MIELKANLLTVLVKCHSSVHSPALLVFISFNPHYSLSVTRSIKCLYLDRINVRFDFDLHGLASLTSKNCHLDALPASKCITKSLSTSILLVHFALELRLQPHNFANDAQFYLHLHRKYPCS